MNSIINKPVKFKDGRFAGVVGIVEQENDGGWLFVRVEGVYEDKPISFAEWFDPDEMEVV